MNYYSPVKVMASDTGLPEDTHSLAEYIKHKTQKGEMNFSSDGKLMFNVDQSGGMLICCLDDGNKEVYFGYDSDIEIEAVITEYFENIYGKENGAIAIDDKDEWYRFCAELDFYIIEKKLELPAIARLRIHALALDVKFFKGKSEFDSFMNTEPVAVTNEGKSVYFGTDFMTPSGIMPGNEDKMFPAMSYIISEIKNIEKKANSFTNKEFYVLTCSLSFGDFELLCSLEIMNEDVKVGSIVQGYVMFRAEILEIKNADITDNENQNK